MKLVQRIWCIGALAAALSPMAAHAAVSAAEAAKLRNEPKNRS